ncbi:MAG TPA: hypothetical protein VKH81_24030 [Candidatus Angelobacter sp.]|nr:hypothetical protein [Candidatus Angelobacter sp.]
MHEIDPQSGDRQSQGPQSDVRLAKALKRLASSSPRAASPEIGNSLLGEFRRHHARRRRIRRTNIGVLVACLALIASFVSLRNRPHSRPQTARQTQNSPTVPPAQAAMTPVPPIAAARPTSSAKHASTKNASTKNASKTQRAATVLNAANREFLALPGYDPAVPKDELRVVRVHVPASTLWQIGAPVSASAGTHSVTADVVVSQSGTPYAVRLVQ